MKRLSFQLSIWILCIGMSGCQSDDQRIFDKNADKRLNDVLQAYKKTLIAAPDGWKVTYFPNTATFGAWSFVMKFAEDGQVVMKSDYLESGALLSGAGLYQVKDFEGPGLSFTSFLPITELVEASYSFPAGHYGENDFLFTAMTPDTLFLRGRKHGADFVLTRAKAADWDAIDRHQDIMRILKKPPTSVYRNVVFYKSGDRMEFEYSPYFRYAQVKSAQDEPKKGIGIGFTDTGLIVSPSISRAGKPYDILVYDKKNDRFVDKLIDPTLGIQYDDQPAFLTEDYKAIGTAPPLGSNAFVFLLSAYRFSPFFYGRYIATRAFMDEFDKLKNAIQNGEIKRYKDYDIDVFHLKFNMDEKPVGKKNAIYFYNADELEKDVKKRKIAIYFNFEKSAGKVFLSRAADQDLSDAELVVFGPILDFFFDPKGLYVARFEGSELLGGFPLYAFTSATRPAARVYMFM